MRILICGGRDYADTAAFAEAMHTLKQKHAVIDLVINGGAPGADKLARAWALVEEIDCVTVPARWSKLGKAAGPARNARMLDYLPQAAVAFPGGPGTANMVRQLRDARIPVWIPYGGVDA